MKSKGRTPLFFKKIEEDLSEKEFDIYSDDFDDEEAIDRGMKGFEAAFLQGFRKHN